VTRVKRLSDNSDNAMDVWEWEHIGPMSHYNDLYKISPKNIKTLKTYRDF